ncbi:Uncharacterised protein [Candidatus Anstonella stagnisolia]|nr:Uncharacterised protein [Candidatus Anstonella stagnisolia]
MRFGYMPSASENLLCEIEFAKENFDFVEVTYVPGADVARIGRRALEAALSDFPSKGHLHWKCDFSKASPFHIQNALEQLSFFSSVGIKEVTVHPSSNKSLFSCALIRNNTLAFSRLCDFSDSSQMSLYVENTFSFPFNKPPALNSLLHHFPNLKFTFDIGHSLADYSENYSSFLHFGVKKPSHIHLHDAIPSLGFDHLPFTHARGRDKMLDIMRYAKKFNPRATVSLEIFYEMKNGKRVPIEEKRRKNILLKHLKTLRSNLCSR